MSTHTDNTIAPGHNPDGLTVAQVGDGYRLLTSEEVFSRHTAKTKDDPRIWCWCEEDGGCWCDGYDGANANYSYRVADDCLSYLVEPPAPEIDWKARAEAAEQERDRLRGEVERMTRERECFEAQMGTDTVTPSEAVADLRAQLAAAQEDNARILGALRINAEYWAKAKSADTEGCALIVTMQQVCDAARKEADK